jgi:hypothetical protein
MTAAAGGHFRCQSPARRAHGDFRRPHQDRFQLAFDLSLQHKRVQALVAFAQLSARPPPQHPGLHQPLIRRARRLIPLLPRALFPPLAAISASM